MRAYSTLAVLAALSTAALSIENARIKLYQKRALGSHIDVPRDLDPAQRASTFDDLGTQWEEVPPRGPLKHTLSMSDVVFSTAQPRLRVHEGFPLPARLPIILYAAVLSVTLPNVHNSHNLCVLIDQAMLSLSGERMSAIYQDMRRLFQSACFTFHRVRTLKQIRATSWWQ